MWCPQDIRVLKLKALDMQRDLSISKNAGGSMDELKVSTCCNPTTGCLAFSDSTGNNARTT